MKLLSHILIPLAGTAMMTSCLSSVKPDGGHGFITFEPVVGAEVRAATLSAFPENMSLGVWAVTEDGQTYIDREEVSFDGEKWSTASPREWPEGTALRFYGFAPYEHQMKMETGGRMVIEDYDLSVKEDAQGLYIAEPTGMLTGDKGAVHMAFRLASAKIDFRIDNGLNQVTNVKLEKIILSGVYCKGSFDSSADPQWTVSGEPSDLVGSGICRRHTGNHPAAVASEGQGSVFVPVRRQPLADRTGKLDGRTQGRMGAGTPLYIHADVDRRHSQAFARYQQRSGITDFPGYVQHKFVELK